MGEAKGNGKRSCPVLQELRAGGRAKDGRNAAGLERAGPVNPKPPRDRRLPHVTDDAPTLASLGITKRESAEAQSLAKLPLADFEKLKTGDDTRAAVRRQLRAKRDRARKSARCKCNAIEGVRRGDFRNVLSDLHNVNAIITDPPYGKDALPLWRDLGVFAAKVLAEDGVLLAYSGQMYLPEVLDALRESLDYFWCCAVFHEGSGNLTPLGHPVRKVINEWKPVLFFCKKNGGFPRTFRDVLRAGKPDKSAHNWQQPISEAEWLIEQFTEKGETVVDPFAGSGTVAKAARNCGRRFIGAEILL